MKTSTKICRDCKINKNLKEYSYHANYKDNIKPRCNLCEALRVKAYYKTKDGLLSQIYQNQKKNSKRRGHKQPLYTKQELKEWLFSQSNFNKLYNDWKESDFNRNPPSIDRLNDNKGYSFDNIRLVSWRDNENKANIDRLNGINASERICIKVLQYTKNNIFICGYVSQKEAERQTGVHQGSISSCCLRKIPSAGGYVWKIAT